MRIPLFRPVIREEAIDAAAAVLRSGWLGLGPRTEAFEREFASYVGAPHCVGLDSGTSAVHLALRTLDLPPEADVITTALTFVSTNFAIKYVGGRPVFADIEPETGNIALGAVRELLSESTGAIVLVHYGGYPCDVDGFYELSRDAGVPIVEDCAHACGAVYRGRRIGGHGNLHAFSFNAVKNLPMGNGGAVTVRRPEDDMRLRRLRALGVDADVHKRMTGEGYHWDYGVTEIGFRNHMNDLQAAIGLAQLRCLDEDNARRAAIAAFYRGRLAGVPGISLLHYEDDRTSSYHLFCILAEDRDALVAKLRKSGVDIGVHYRRNDDFPIFERAELPNVDRFWRRVISLPMHVSLSDDEVGYVTDVIRSGW